MRGILFMSSWKVWLALLLLSLMAIVMVAGPVAPDHGVNTANLDTTCAPCKDFNQFANGGWMAKNPVPPAYPSWGVANEVNERNRNILHEILEGAAKNTMAVRGSSEQKIGDYYGSFKDSTQVTGEVDQGGLGLPDRDYYTRDDAKSKDQRAEYVKHVAKMFELMGDAEAAAATEAQTVVDLETQLAKVSQTVVERRDPQNVYHRMPQTGLKTLAPSFPWEDYFTAVVLANKGDVNVTAPEFFKGMGQMVAAQPMANWKTYLRWHLINKAAP